MNWTSCKHLNKLPFDEYRVLICFRNGYVCAADLESPDEEYIECCKETGTDITRGFWQLDDGDWYAIEDEDGPTAWAHLPKAYGIQFMDETTLKKQRTRIQNSFFQCVHRYENKISCNELLTYEEILRYIKDNFSQRQMLSVRGCGPRTIDVLVYDMEKLGIEWKVRYNDYPHKPDYIRESNLNVILKKER